MKEGHGRPPADPALGYAFMADALDGEPIRPLPLPDRTSEVAAIIPGVDGEYPIRRPAGQIRCAFEVAPGLAGDDVTRKGTSK